MVKEREKKSLGVSIASLKGCIAVIISAVEDSSVVYESPLSARDILACKWVTIVFIYGTDSGKSYMCEKTFLWSKTICHITEKTTLTGANRLLQDYSAAVFVHHSPAVRIAFAVSKKAAQIV